MKFIRRKFVLRCFCTFSVVVILNSIVYPTASYALTSGPHQPEYTSYEDSSATDMVNLATGDFSFNTPVLGVPVGSSGVFPVPLSYHAGIGPDQEASWIGLGWNINVGSVTRDINGFPDDANNDPQTVTVQQLNLDRGWTSQFLGNSIGWDSNVGYYGTIDLSDGDGMALVGFGKNASYGIRGLTISGGETHYNAKVMRKTLINVAQNALSALSGPSGWAMIIYSKFSTLLQDGLGGAPAPELGSQGYWAATQEKSQRLFHTNYWVNLKQSRVEDMYGILNLDKAASVPAVSPGNFLKIKHTINGTTPQLNQFEQSGTVLNKGAASDINIDLSATPNYWDNTSPALLAYDNFYVNGPGVSGAIKPYRMELGSVSVPREMTIDHIRLNPVPYLDYGSTKVPFVYDGAMGNNYFNHVGAASGTVTNPTFYYGINSAAEASLLGSPGPNTYFLRYDLTDVVMDNAKIRLDVASTKRIPQAHFVDWMTNLELKTTGNFSASSAYMDYFRGADRDAFRSSFTFGGKASYYSTGSFNGTTISFPSGPNTGNNFSNGQTISANVVVYHPVTPGLVISSTSYNNSITVSSHTANSIDVSGMTAVTFGNPVIEVISNAASTRNHTIGGFVITDPSGMNYHFALPVYDYSFFSKTWKQSDPTSNSTISRTPAFANTWLLTAITGPDFVDRGGAGNLGDGYIDESDWGYWVKFNYGKAGDSFAWATPFNKQKPSSDDQVYTYASGSKEKYFLNTIETRSHVAMFIKSTRGDAYDANSVQTNNLRLSEIALMTKDAYNKLVSKYHLADVSGRINTVYNSVSFTPGSYMTNFLRASSIKRILFTQDYSLCPEAPTSPTGKLTLKSVSVVGRYDSVSSNINKVLPDMKFEYGSNPSYDPNKWDGWGMYSSTGTSSGLTHKTSPLATDGLSWSLAKVTTPEGAEILVSYERDTYSSISGSPIPATDFRMSGIYNVTTTQASISKFIADDLAYIQPGVPLNLAGKFAYKCPGEPDSTYVPFSATSVVSAVNTTTREVTLSSNYGPAIHCSSGQPVDVKVQAKWAQATKQGGNLRVKSLQLNDPAGQSYKTVYQYNNGTVAQEPDYIKTSDLPFYSYISYPYTPVIYGQVTVLNGMLTTESDYHAKQIYNFITPNTSQYEIVTTKPKDKIFANANGSSIDYTSLIRHDIKLHTKKIGKMTYTATYENNNFTPVSESNYTYTEALTNNGVAGNQGVFSEGTLLFEAVMATGTTNRYHRAQRTTALTYPIALQKIETTQDGLTSKTESKNWDPMTGAVLETRETSPMGLITQTITVPAYTKYWQMDSKAKLVFNKNMLSQNAATYMYKFSNGGNQTGLISGSATTWKKDWANYRVYDNTQQKYINSEDSPANVWRTNQNYSWNGDYSRLQAADGTQAFSSADEFNFATITSNTKWQLTGSTERYSHNSMPLEVKGMDKIFSAGKMGYMDQLPIATASNAHYEEIAFSGAEDLIAGSTSPYFFGGEVSLTNGTIVSSPVHTGTRAISVTSGYGFVFKSNNLYSPKSYKASVWSNSPNGRIYYKINGSGTEVSNPPQTQTQVGSWYKIDCIIPSGIIAIEIGVKSASGTVVFDDFRFQPLQSAMTTYVYDPVTKAVTHSLDNDNLYTRFEYSGRGLLIKTYVEVIKYGGERLISETKDNYKRFHTN